MKDFFSINDVDNLQSLVQESLELKASPRSFSQLGIGKMLGLVFLNPSLRTRMSTQKAALNLGMDVIVMNMTQDGWALETRDGVVMDGNSVEHIREAAAVMGQYCDIIGLRSFPSLKNRDEDYSESLFTKFKKFCKVPLISLESATRHPLQSLTDLITIKETWSEIKKPKILLAWAPHIKSLPQAVPNSFSEWMCRAKQDGMLDFSICQPKGYELSEEFTEGADIHYNLDEVIGEADYIYVKNWSSYKDYGRIYSIDQDWMLDKQKLNKQECHAKVMHCLPVRRDLELGSDILDSPHSLVIQQAGNRVWAAQAVLKRILES